jgi:diguanylate cyclase (GGDEF)-like protein
VYCQPVTGRKGNPPISGGFLHTWGLKKMVIYRQKFFLGISLLILGLTGNYFNFSLHFGVDLIFGGIASLIAVRYFGLLYGGCMTMVISGYTFLLWNHPYAALIFTMEALFVGYCYKKSRWKNIILIDVVYWVFIGIPLVFISYYYFLNMNFQGTLVIALKDFINGALNAWLAGVVMLCISYWRNKKFEISLMELFLNIITGIAIVFPLLLITLLGNHDVKKIEKQLNNDVQNELISISSFLKEKSREYLSLTQKTTDMYNVMDNNIAFESYFSNLNKWDFSAVMVLSAEGLPVFQSGEKISPLLFTEIDTTRPQLIYDNENKIFYSLIPMKGKYNNHVMIYIINQDKIDLQLHAKFKESFHYRIYNKDNALLYGSGHSKVDMIMLNSEQIKLTYDLNKNISPMITWNKSSFGVSTPLNEENNWKLLIEIPLGPYQKEIYDAYITNFIVAIIAIILSLITSFILNLYFIHPIRKMVKISNEFSNRLNLEYYNVCFESGIEEVNHLLENFNSVARSLKEKFQEMNESQKNYQYLALHDQLTKLPNRLSLFHRMKELMDRSPEEPPINIALLYLDLDRFKYINEKWGQVYGDLVLEEVANRLTLAFDERDMVVRLGDDEFAVLVENIDSVLDADEAGRKVIELFRLPINILEKSILISTSIGISVYPWRASNDIELDKQAVIALDWTKKNGKNKFEMFKDHMIQESDLFNIISNLSQNIEGEEFTLYYQPKVNALNDDVIGAEALIRWEHPDFGFISPAKFIPVAEELGTIIPLGRWIIRQVFIQLNMWKKQGLKLVPVAINISPVQLQNDDLVAFLKCILNETQIDPSYIEFEITEGVSLINDDSLIMTLEELKGMGFRISLDDFGTGYSSLGYLKKYPFDTLKIDQSFIRTMSENEEDLAIVKAIISIGQSLKLSIIAEGVETEHEKQLLLDMNCIDMQGYLFSPALAPDHLIAWLSKEIAY